MEDTNTSSEGDRWTRPAIVVVSLCFLVYIFDVYEISTFQVVLPAILADFNLSLLDAGVLFRRTSTV